MQQIRSLKLLLLVVGSIKFRANDGWDISMAVLILMLLQLVEQILLLQLPRVYNYLRSLGS